MKQAVKSKNLRTSAPAAAPSAVDFPVIGIGASAGGIEAISQLLQRLPAEPGVALVIILHLSPDHHSLAAEILGRTTAMPVVGVEEGGRLQVNRVYVIPPSSYLSIAAGQLRLRPRAANPGLYLPIDFFFSSLAAEAKSKAIGVVLSGTASDGTQGLLAIKAAGGVTFAQEPMSAKYSGMPETAIAQGAVDFVMTPEGIADEIVRMLQHPQTAATLLPTTVDTAAAMPIRSTEEALSRIFAELLSKHRRDFRHYDRPYIMRGIARRMVQVTSPDLSD